MAKEKPVREIRRGSVKIAIWKNENSDGSVRYSSTVRRIYKDGDKWKSTASLSASDMPALAMAATAADLFVNSKLEQQRAGQQCSTS